MQIRNDSTSHRAHGGIVIMTLSMTARVKRGVRPLIHTLATSLALLSDGPAYIGSKSQPNRNILLRVKLIHP